METFKTLAAIATVFLGVPITVMMLIDRLSTGKYKPPTEKEATVAREKLLNPDWEALESHFGSPAPEVLRKMYIDKLLLGREDFELPGPSPEEGRYIAGFLPAAAETLQMYEPSADYFPFAVDGSGGYYAIHWLEGQVGFWGHAEDEPEILGAFESIVNVRN